MSDSLIERIDKRLEELRTNRTAASVAAGLGRTFIRDLARGKGANPSIDSLRKLAVALKLSVEDLTTDTESATLPPQEVAINQLVVMGTIEAGQFRDITLADQDEEDREVINVARDPRFPRARQYALKVSGDSMDELFPDRSYVTVVDFWDSGLEPKDGLVVHVERRIADTHLVETTLKEIKRQGAEVILVPRSSNAKHKPIPMAGDGKTEIVICGVVTGKWEPLRI